MHRESVHVISTQLDKLSQTENQQEELLFWIHRVLFGNHAESSDLIHPSIPHCGVLWLVFEC